jgi:hypothetical protein
MEVFWEKSQDSKLVEKTPFLIPVNYLKLLPPGIKEGE